VRANAVRALGNLARFANFLAETCDANCKPNTCDGVILKSYEKPSHLVNAQVPTSQWLDKMVQTFVSCITTGNVKVRLAVLFHLLYKLSEEHSRSVAHYVVDMYVEYLPMVSNICLKIDS
jgi:hypothetical protein